MKLCPQCHVGNVEIGEQVVAKPLGTFSLAGMQLKASAHVYATASCTNDSCDWKVYGHLEDAVFDNHGTFTSGHFVVDPLVPPPATPDE